MAVITPQTDLYLLKSPLSMNGNTLNFKDKTAQANYFLSLPRISADDFTYQRKDNVIRFPAQYDAIVQYNYVMYRNDAYSNKWFYAFITNMRYVNDNMTEISIATDVFQTWEFDVAVKESFVEREHVSDDTIGAHTVPEGLETGEYVVQSVLNENYVRYSNNGVTQNALLCIGVSERFDTFEGVEMQTGFSTNINQVNGITQGLTYLILPNDYGVLRKFILDMYQDNSKSDAVVTIFLIPATFFREESNWSIVAWKYKGDLRNCWTVNSSEKPLALIDFTSYGPSNIDGYKPRNNKLLTFPYCYELLTNNGGGEAIYRWEDFTNRNAHFKVIGDITQGMSVKCYPTNYLKTTDTNGWEYGVTAQKLPVCSWTTDFYVSWLNQQGANLNYQVGTGILRSIVGGGNSSLSLGMSGASGSSHVEPTLGTAGSVLSAGTGIVNSALGVMDSIHNALQQQYEASLVPDQARGNINSGDVNFSADKSGFTCYDMCIKSEYARIVDDYFDKYGYKVNRVKVPAIDSRKNWNYIKTIGCNLTGNCPQDDLVAFENLYDNGLTIWHNPATMYDYSQPNGIK